MSDTLKETWFALQICDASFPGGGFAHSQGLESALFHGFITQRSQQQQKQQEQKQQNMREHDTSLLPMPIHFVNQDPQAPLFHFIKSTLEQSAHQQLPLVRAACLASWHAHQALLASNKQQLSANLQSQQQKSTIISSKWLARISDIDRLCQVSMTNSVSKRASINQGKCFLRASIVAFRHCQTAYEYMEILSEALRGTGNGGEPYQHHSSLDSSLTSSTNRTPAALAKQYLLYAHYSTIFGAVCGLLDLSLTMTSLMFMRCQVRDLLSAACRLGIIGPLEGAHVQSSLCEFVEKLLSQQTANTAPLCAVIPLDDSKQVNTISLHNFEVDIDELPLPVQTSPILEILQTKHDQLYARLFNS